MRELVFDLVDEAYLSNDELVVCNRGVEDRFPLANVRNVDAGMKSSPERITLLLSEECAFGKEVTFSKPVRWFSRGRHPLAEELDVALAEIRRQRWNGRDMPLSGGTGNRGESSSCRQRE